MSAAPGPGNATADRPTGGSAGTTGSHGPPHASGRLADAVAVLGVYLALGVVTGVLWWLLVEPAVFVVGPDGGLGMGEDQLSLQFRDEGWYAVVAGVAGLVSGAVVTWWRDRDPLLTVFLVLAGAVAAAAVMALVGGVLGPPDPASLTGLRPGETVPAALRLDAVAAYLVWPILALVGALLVLWGPTGVESDKADTDDAPGR